MTRQNTAGQFYIDDHAVLFAVCTRNILENMGQRGFSIIEESVITYGKERGARMAMRCLRDGLPLDGKSYSLYSEWADTKGWSKVEIAQLSPYRFNCTVCGWCSSWQDKNLSEYGRLYCYWVDHAILQGFNPELTMQIDGCLSQGDKHCSFAISGCSYASETDFTATMQKKKDLPPDVVKDFLYHCGHLYAAIRRVLIMRQGVFTANSILKKSLADYSAIFSSEKALAIQNEARLNFLAI